MKRPSRTRICLTVAVAALLAQPMPTLAQNAAPAAKSETKGSKMPEDGQHDFDWMFGTWKVKLKRLQKPLTGSTTWIEFEGTQTTQKVWGGRANMDEFVAESPATKTRLEGLTVRLYNPETRQWSIYWANAKNGTLGLPPTVGHFTNGRGEFYDEEEYEGRPIVVRYVWSDITPTSAHFEQAFSTDGGKTWEPNWISTITRVKD